MTFSPEAERLLHRSISPQIILLDDDNSIAEQIKIGLEVENITRQVAKGELSLWEMCELLEEYDEYDIDDWIEEIEENIEHGLRNQIIVAPY